MFGYTVSRTAQTAEISTQTEDHRYGADFDMAKHVADVKPCSDEQAILGCLLLVLLSVSPPPLSPSVFFKTPSAHKKCLTHPKHPTG
jgi:hypothetical protein